MEDAEEDEMDGRTRWDRDASKERPRAEGRRAGTSARLGGTFAVERRKGEGCALLVVEMDGEVTSRLSHSSLQ